MKCSCLNLTRTSTYTLVNLSAARCLKVNLVLTLRGRNRILLTQVNIIPLTCYVFHNRCHFWLTSRQIMVGDSQKASDLCLVQSAGCVLKRGIWARPEGTRVSRTNVVALIHQILTLLHILCSFKWMHSSPPPASTRSFDPFPSDPCNLQGSIARAFALRAHGFGNSHQIGHVFLNTYLYKSDQVRIRSSTIAASCHRSPSLSSPSCITTNQDRKRTQPDGKNDYIYHLLNPKFLLLYKVVVSVQTLAQS